MGYLTVTTRLASIWVPYQPGADSFRCRVTIGG